MVFCSSCDDVPSKSEFFLNARRSNSYCGTNEPSLDHPTKWSDKTFGFKGIVQPKEKGEGGS
jgi:hypothetical protein